MPVTADTNGKDIYAWCPEGKQVLGGGYSVEKGPEIIPVSKNEPIIKGGIYEFDDVASLTRAQTAGITAAAA